MANRLVIGDAPRARGRKRWPKYLLFLGLLMVGLHYFVISLAEIRGDAMAPNALEGDLVLVLHTKSPMVGDVVVVEGDPNPVLRRLLGRAGDRVSAKAGRLIRNGEALDARSLGQFAFREGDRVLRQHLYWEAISPDAGHDILADYVSAPRSWRLDFPEQEVPEGHVFVYCDNRRQCPEDARAGVISEGAISGVAWGTMWFGDARVVPPPERPILGAYSPLRSAAGSVSDGVGAFESSTEPRR